MKTSEGYRRSGSCIAVIWDLRHENIVIVHVPVINRGTVPYIIVSLRIDSKGN